MNYIKLAKKILDRKDLLELNEINYNNEVLIETMKDLKERPQVFFKYFINHYDFEFLNYLIKQFAKGEK